MKFTAHASRRCDQRAIPRTLVKLIIRVGDEFKCGKGCRIICARSKNAHKELVKGGVLKFEMGSTPMWL